jgi:hypothetical protein
MNNTTGKAVWTPTLEDEIDLQFIQRVQAEVTQSCALPFALPAERVTANIINAAQWFWQNSDFAVEERYYILKNSDICRGNVMNKIAQLPPQIIGVHGVYKIQEGLKYGAMGDFSIERMMMSTYSMFGGVGTVGGGFVPGTTQGYSLTDVVMSMYEVDTFNQNLNPTLTYNFNPFSSKLVLLGDLGYSDVLICCSVRCRIQDLYNDYYFFRAVVAFCKRNLSTIYGMYEFKLPGGVTINYDKLADQAENDLEEIKEYFENNRAVDYFFMPNTL